MVVIVTLVLGDGRREEGLFQDDSPVSSHLMHDFHWFCVIDGYAWPPVTRFGALFCSGWLFSGDGMKRDFSTALEMTEGKARNDRVGGESYSSVLKTIPGTGGQGTRGYKKRRPSHRTISSIG